MIPFFPKKFANKGILVYFLSLGIISIAFYKYAMRAEFILMGIMWVVGFFMFASHFSKKWSRLPNKSFTKTIFLVALFIRLGWMTFSYFYYSAQTGQPFEFGAADSFGYHEEAEWLAEDGWKIAFEYWGKKGGVSDVGYPFWLTLVYSIFGPSVIVARTIKCFLSAYTCILIYRLSKRNIGELPGRMAAIFCVFMPNLIMYCGMHLKETEMLFLTVAFIEETDSLLRKMNYSIWNILISFLLGLSLFFFRTVLGLSAFFALFTALLLLPNRTIKSRAKRILLITWCTIGAIFLAGGTIANEIESTWDRKDTEQSRRRIEQTSRGNQWAQYATAAVLAPMEFIMPLATMIDTDEQYNQQMLSGGNFIRNYFGFFVLLSLVISTFRKKEWKLLSLVGSFTIMYLLIVSLSGFANSERFLLPTMPFLLIFASYGISNIKVTDLKYVNVWMYALPLIEIGWAYFKLGSRGLL